MTNDIELLYGSGMAGDTHEGADERLGASVKYLRERTGMTQAELARRMTELGWPWHQSTVYRVESGRQSLRFPEAVDVATVLNTPLQWLTWGGPAVNAAAVVDRSMVALHGSWREASNAVSRLLAAIATAERTVADAQFGKYEQARELVRQLEAELGHLTLETAVADGIAIWEHMHETGEDAEPDSLGRFAVGINEGGKFFITDIDHGPDDETDTQNVTGDEKGG